VHQRILAAGFQVIRSNQVFLSREKVEQFYAEHAGRFFHNRLVTFMHSGPVQAYILAHPDAVQRWREVMGPTKTFRAQYEAPDTLRGSFGLTDTRNLCHGSDSHDSAVREISFFFPEFSVEQWQQWDEPFYRRGESKLDEETFTHLIEKNNHVGPQCNSQ